jgi:hypothetical protein
MKRELYFFLSFAAFLGFMNLADAQNVGVTDKSGVTPANLLQVHKNGTTTTTHTLIQISDDGTGEASTDGFQLGIDSSQNGIIVNKESGKGIWIGRSGTNNTTIENDGTVVFNGAATVWDDIRVSFASRGASTAPTFGIFGSGPQFVWTFTQSDNGKYLFCEVQLPHGYKEGSDIIPHVHWAPSTTNTGNVVWVMDYQWQNNGGTYGTNVSITATEAANGTALKSQMTSFGAINGAGKSISSILLIKFYRYGGSDSFTGSAYLLGFDVHYEINTVGSRTTTGK